MELLASQDEKQIWFQEISRPYRLDANFFSELYVCILFANDESITSEEQSAISDQIVASGCRYAVCAGHKCSSWDTSIGCAYIETDENFKPPDETFVMTSWHERSSVEDVLFMGLMSTSFDDHDFTRYLVLFIGQRPGLLDEVRKGIQEVWPHSRIA